MKTILLTGGSGLLGKELQRINKKFNLIAPPSNEMNIEEISQIEAQISANHPDVFLHCGALTRPMSIHDESPDKSIKINIIGTSNVVLACMKHDLKLVFISTDYVYPGNDGNYKEQDALNPSNKYAWSKLGGESAVKIYDNSLILRSSFRERPFAHPRAFTDAYKPYLYYDEIAPIILKILEKDVMGVLNVGGDRKSVYEFAKESNPDVGKISRKEIGDWVPEDTSMDLSKLKQILND